jgi:hypothetical protein
VTAPVPETFGNVGPWQRYVARERAARGAYLATVESAHHEYLAGPWPDRDAYQHVEQTAWITYYAAGREAWKYYTQEIVPPPPPPVPGPAFYPTAGGMPPLNEFDQRQETYLASDYREGGDH